MSTRFSSSDLGGGSHWNNTGNQGEKYIMSKENERKSIRGLFQVFSILMNREEAAGSESSNIYDFQDLSGMHSL